MAWYDDLDAYVALPRTNALTLAPDGSRLVASVSTLDAKRKAWVTSLWQVDPDGEVNLAWQCYQQLRSIYHATTTTGRQIAAKVIDSFPTCPIPEVAPVIRTVLPAMFQADAFAFIVGTLTAPRRWDARGLGLVLAELP